MQTRSSVRAVADKNVKRTYHPKLRGRSRLKDIYDMSAPVRGHCLIFANSCFDRRSGLGVLKEYTFDSERLETVFRQLYFEVHVFRNSTGLDILAQITSYSQDVDVNQNAFVVVILTHGTAKHLLGSDFVGYNETPDAIITEKQILEIVSNRSCPGLVGKPKMFFIQACRGELEDQGVGLDGSALSHGGNVNETDLDHTVAIGACVQRSGSPTGVSENAESERQRHASVAGSLPTRTDVLVCYSTLLDYRSFVGTHGSIFGQELAKALILYAYNTDLQHIINKMSKSMADIETLSRMGNKAVNVKQAISVRYDGWTCKLYFNPGYPKLKSLVRDVISEQTNQSENHESDTDTTIVPTNDSVVSASSNSNDQGQPVPRSSRKRARSGAETASETVTVKARVTRSQHPMESSAKGTRSSPGKRAGTQKKEANRDQRTLDNFLSLKQKTQACHDPHADAGQVSLSEDNSTEAASAVALTDAANEIHPNSRLKNSYIQDYFSSEATAGPSNGRKAVAGAPPPGTTEDRNKQEHIAPLKEKDIRTYFQPMPPAGPSGEQRRNNGATDHSNEQSEPESDSSD